MRPFSKVTCFQVERTSFGTFNVVETTLRRIGDGGGVFVDEINQTRFIQPLQLFVFHGKGFGRIRHHCLGTDGRQIGIRVIDGSWSVMHPDSTIIISVHTYLSFPLQSTRLLDFHRTKEFLFNSTNSWFSISLLSLVRRCRSGLVSSIH